jgi:hypothetical protein
MAKAKKTTLTDLHSRLAEVLTDALDTTTDQDGKTVGPNAAILNVARQFLKDNQITADLDKSPELSKLNERLNSLPSFAEDDDETPGYAN